MTKKSIAVDELEKLALQMLKEIPQCEGAEAVTIDRVEENLQAGNWRVSSFNPGNSERDLCEAALWDIEDKLLPEYEIAG